MQFHKNYTGYSNQPVVQAYSHTREAVGLRILKGCTEALPQPGWTRTDEWT